jgi:hypothetical protein
MNDVLPMLQAEALCSHAVEVRLGDVLPAYVVTHQTAERTMLSVPLVDVIRGKADLRLAILDFLCALHDHDAAVTT